MWTSLEVVGWPSDPVLLGAFPLADGHTSLFGSNLTGREGPVSCTLLPVRVGIRPISAQSSPSCSVGFSALLPDPVLPGIYD